ncbi:MAG: MarR family winged helix-turn-helix transcriptional regulator [Clostridiales Family XIII bacterium]|jgi:DNA-binding MarR family transcriptional regulator|nr:MarR family winged helix-turn-helix transcriptional regulator [Clostridiales Family XIII bacterium]
MDEALKEQFTRALQRMHRIPMLFPPQDKLRMTELLMMKKISGVLDCTAPHGPRPRGETPVYVSEIHENLFITKSAVSQTLGVLEKKGYIAREIDKKDRRKIAVTLTAEGEAELKKSMSAAEQVLETLVSRFGESDTKKLIELFERFADTAEAYKQELADAPARKDF